MSDKVAKSSSCESERKIASGSLNSESGDLCSRFEGSVIPKEVILNWSMNDINRQ